MMIFSPIDQVSFDKSATNISYCKMFPRIMEDFLTRRDCMEMMATSNLSVSTTVSTAVQVVVPAGTGTGVGTGKGNCTPVYIGDAPRGGSQALAQQRKAEKESGGAATQATVAGLNG